MACVEIVWALRSISVMIYILGVGSTSQRDEARLDGMS
jgi:hypothetical protein